MSSMLIYVATKDGLAAPDSYVHVYVHVYVYVCRCVACPLRVSSVKPLKRFVLD